MISSACSFSQSDFEATNKATVDPLHSTSVLKKHVQFPDNFDDVVHDIFGQQEDDSNVNGSDTIAIETPPSVIVVSF